MKKTILFFTCLAVSLNFAFGQTNTFPASGNVGIGTTNPSSDMQLEIFDGNFGKLKVGLVTYVGSTWAGYTGKAIFGRNVYTRDYDNVRIMSTNNFGIGAQYMEMTNDKIAFHMVLGNTVKETIINNPVVVFKVNGVGIGTSAPQGALDIKKDPSVPGNEIYFTGQSGDYQNSNSLRLNFVGYDQKAGFGIQAVNVSSYGLKDLVFYGHNAADYTTYQEVVRFRYNGKVGIGTSSPQAKLDVNGNIYSNGKIFIGTPDPNTVNEIAPYALAVDGSAIFTKATVKLAANWPDYVFSPSYQLMPMDSLERFIKTNGHLPEVPTANEVEENGIDLGASQALLLKKIEELTLIIIEQGKRLREQGEKIKEIQEQIDISVKSRIITYK